MERRAHDEHLRGPPHHRELTGADTSQTTRLAVDVHHFSLAKQGSFATSTLRQEIDVTFTYRHTGNLGITAGHSIIFADDPMIDLGRAAGTVHFGYIMLDATF